MAISKVSKMNLKTLKNPNDKTKLVFISTPNQSPEFKLLISGHLIQVDLESSDMLINNFSTTENTVKIMFRNSFSNELWKLTVTLQEMK